MLSLWSRQLRDFDFQGVAAVLRCATRFYFKAILWVFSVIYFTFLPVKAGALEYSFVRENPINGVKVDSYKFLLARGRIEPGDYQRLKDFLRTEPALTHFVNSRTLIFSSPGGDVREALKLGEFVRKTYSEVLVGDYFGPCLSSCFLVLASAVSRDWQAKTVGLHRPYLPPEVVDRRSVPEVIEDQGRVMTAVESYMKSLRVPDRLIDIMMSTPSDKIVWLDEPTAVFGRYARSYEQMLVSKCGLDVDLERRYFSGERNIPLKSIVTPRNCGMRLTFTDAMNYFVKELGGKQPFER